MHHEALAERLKAAARGDRGRDGDRASEAASNQSETSDGRWRSHRDLTQTHPTDASADRSPLRSHASNVDRALVSRIRGEYLEMPGLCVTAVQAARLWAIDRATCAAVLDMLVAEGFLQLSRRGTYVRAMAT